jgi:RHS repeat-associated protein
VGLWGPPVYADGGTILIQSQRDRYYNYPGATYPYLVGLLRTRSASCPQGYATRTNSHGTWDCWKAPPVQCSNSNCGDPVSLAYGEMLQNEVDYDPGVIDSPKITRYYRSGSYFRPNGGAAGAPVLSDYWRWTWQRTLYSLSMPGVSAAVQREDGAVVYYNSSGQEILNRDGAAEVLTALGGGGWTITRANSDVETYNAAGQLTQYKTVSGLFTTLTYSATSIIIVDSFGHQITYHLNSSGQIVSATLPSGALIQYGYSATGQLTNVTFADQTSKTYWYEDPSSPWLLTGVSDELTVRYSTFTYQSGIVASESLAGGVYSWSFNSSVVGHPNSGGYSLVTDPLNNRRQYNFIDANGVIKDQGVYYCPTCDVPANASYDSNGNIQSKQDFNGNTTTYQFDETRNLELSRTEASGNGQARTITTQWNPTFRVPAEISVYAGATANGTPLRQTSYEYYPGTSNVEYRTITDPTVTPNVSRIWTYTYDSYGRILTVKDPRTDVNSTTTYAYYTCTTGYQCGQIETITNALNQVTTFNTYNAYGQPLTITDPNGVVTTLTYDARQHLKSRQVGTETTSYAYFPTGLLKTVTLPDSSTIGYAYDGAHRLTDITDGLGNHIHYVLDNMGNRTSENTYDPSNALRRSHTRAINALNELYQDINAAGIATTFGYDNNGNQTSIAAPMSRNTTQTYDALNRLSQIHDAIGHVTVLEYDVGDQLTAVLDPQSHLTYYNYDGFEDRTKQVSPDSGTTVSTYDSGGNLKTSTDARGALATYSYDALNRVTQIAYADQTITLTYDTGTNGVGRLTGASDANHSMSWAYDTHGRVTGKGQVVGGVTRSVGYGFTNDDLVSMVTPSGQTVTYAYANHRIASISVNGTAILTNATYDPFGPANAWTWGNGHTEARNFDLDGNLSTVVMLSETVTAHYDNASRISSIGDNYSTGYTWSLGYDALDRLTSASKSGTTYGWTYDANGNRLSQTGTAASTFTPSTSSNQLTSTSGSLARTYAYDAAGNTRSYSNLAFTYNQRGRASSVTVGSTSSNYLYNALGQLIEKTAGGATTILVYDEAGHLLGEYTGSGAIIQETIWMGDIPVATLRPNGSSISIYYVETDQLNAPRVIVRTSDHHPVWRWDPDPFGTAAPNQNPYGIGSFIYNLRFPGQYYQAETGLNYNYFRDYDPQTGRYIESDPIGLDGGSMSTYSYVNDDPIDYIDPEGLAGSGAPRRRVRDCNSDEWTRCEAQCGGKGVRSCKRQQLFQPVRTTNRDGTVLTTWIWKDQGLSCDCKDPEACKNAIQKAAAALGLSVTTYLIISEGSRLFPPRNLVPVP